MPKDFTPGLFDEFEDNSFSSNGALQEVNVNAPLAVKMRPQSWQEIVGQEHLLKDGSPLRRLLEPSDKNKGHHPKAVILWGPPGTGKTSLAYLAGQQTNREFVELSAVNAGAKEIRDVIENSKKQLQIYGKETILFVDEVHRLNKAQQDILLPAVENGWVTFMAATTENPSFSVNSALLSRSLLMTLQPLTATDISKLLKRTLQDSRGFNNQLTINEDALNQIVKISGNDARKALTILESAASSALTADNNLIDLEAVENAADVAAVRYDRDGDQHYDVISAFIKSVRGSDPDAALHYLARMIAAGEDPRFIARRLIILASEDIGMADPTALQTAVAAAQAVQLIGMPEGRYSLGEATVHLATAPKSNAVARGIDGALADVRNGRIGSVPVYLRDSHYPAGKAAAQDYKYAHNYPNDVVEQQYLPDDLYDAVYYDPSENGHERQVKEHLKKAAAVQRPDKPEYSGD